MLANINIEIRTVKVRATCGGSYSDCDTYKDHPDWEKLQNQRRHIPAGETALVITTGSEGRNFCLCKKHCIEFLESVKDLSKQAKKLGWH